MVRRGIFSAPGKLENVRGRTSQKASLDSLPPVGKYQPYGPGDETPQRHQGDRLSQGRHNTVRSSTEGRSTHGIGYLETNISRANMGDEADLCCTHPHPSRIPQASSRCTSSSACRQIRDSDALIEPCYDVIEACQYTLDERIELQSTSAYIVDEMVLQGQTSRQRIVCYA